MTEDDARRHAQRMTDTWPSGPKGYVWRELFKTLDGALCHGAYDALMRSAAKAPTTGQFMEHYRALMPRVQQHIVRPDPDGIGLGEYLERLQLRAANGSHEAQAEFDRWHRHLTGQSQWGSGNGGKRRITVEEATRRLRDIA